MEAKEKIKKYKTQSVHYFDNAMKYIAAGDIEKASEFLWGSMAQALKAVAGSRNIWLKSHSQVKKYAIELSRATNDESIRHAFDYAQSLHSNFYESGLLLEDIVIAAEDVKNVVTKLLELIPDGKNS